MTQIKNLFFTLFIFLFLKSGILFSQLSGTYSIPGSFTSIATAITSLNTIGVSGAVTINILAGYTETLSVGGLSLYTIAGASATSPVVFQRSGIGANPIVYAFTGVATPASGSQDGIWSFIGTDYVTIDGIDLQELNTTNPATMEYGYGFFKSSTTNGCQYNTIRNCTITLNRINGVAGNGTSHAGSKAIWLQNALATSQTVAVTTASVQGTNSYNSFYGNMLQNCNSGFVLYGNLSSVTGLQDIGNDIGGTSAVSGNTIVNYGGGGTLTAAAVQASLQSAFNVSYNTVNNNTGTGFIHQGVLWGINNISDRNGSTQLNNNLVSLSSGTLNNITDGIANSAWTANTTTLAVAMNNNTVTGCVIQNGLFYALICGSAPTLLNMNGNLVSNLTVASANGLIRAGVGQTGNVISNTITGVVSTQTLGEINGILVSSAFTTNVSSNLVENITFSANVGATSIAGIESDSKDLSCSGNVLRNFSVPATGTIIGIRQNHTWPSVAGVRTINNNHVYNFSRFPNGPGGGTFMGVLCVGGTVQLQGNSVYSLQSNYVTGTTVCEVQGIKIMSVTIAQVTQNKVNTLNCNSPNGAVYGISTSAATLCNLSNNVVGSLSAPTATGSIKLAGILLDGNTHNVYFNTVYLNTTSTLAGSAALYASGSNTLDLRNNILVNTSVPSGTGVAAAFRSDGNFMNRYSPLSNNNLFYAGTPSTISPIYYDGTVTYSTMASFKVLTGLRDIFSVTENPSFLSTVGTATNYLALQTNVSTQAESGAYPVSGIALDFNGSTRNTQTPDIGAWENNHAGADLLGPGIFSYGFTSPLTACNTAGRTFTVNYGDVSGVASGSLAPRAYYRVNSAAYNSVAGVLTAGTSTNGTWTFNMLYAASPNDIISWYVAAQDMASQANVTAYPSSGFSATDVNNVLTHSAAFSYSVTYTLNGSYTVGTAGTFTSLTRAAHVYNTGCLTGTVQYVLTNTLYATAETFPITFIDHLQASPSTSLVISPQSANDATITGSSSVTAVFKFEGARYISIDGINNQSTQLTIINTATNSFPNASSTIWLASLCRHIGIKRSNIYGASSSSTTARCITSSSASAFVPIAGGGNENITIEGNTFYRCFDAIYAKGINIAMVRNWQIRDNIFGPVNTGTNEITCTAINMHWAENSLVSGNHIRRITSYSYNHNATGIYMEESYTITVSQNTIQNVTSAGYHYPNGAFSGAGIFAGFDTEAISILSNSVTGISSTYSYNPNSGPKGIMVYGMDYNIAPSYIRNNMVSDIHGFSASHKNAWVVGILIAGVEHMFVDHNTVNLSGTHTGTTGGCASAAMMVDFYADSLTVRNNILSNTYYNQSSNTSSVYAFVAGVTMTNFPVNYNSYNASAQTTLVAVALAHYGTSSLTTLAAIQASIGGNQNSIILSPPFTSSVDLHILQNSSAGLSLDNMGTPLGVTTDIDQQPRSSTNPDIGADEFTIPVCTTAGAGTIAPSSVSLCPGNTLVATSFSANIGINAGFQWKVAATPGGPYTSVTTGSGIATPGYTLPVSTATTQYYVLQATCGTSTVTVASNELTVTVQPTPTAGIVVTQSVCTGASLPFTGTTDFANVFNWSGPNNFTSSAQNPVIPAASINHAGVYTLVAFNNNCPSSPATVAVNVTGTPSAFSVTPSFSLSCSVGSTTLVASGAIIPSTYNFTAQISQNTSTALPAVYSAYYGGQKMQMLVLASELNAQNFVAGPLTSIQFPVVSRGVNWGTTTLSNQQFQVSIGQTTLATIGSTFVTGLTVVSPSASFTPQTGYNNWHYFNTPFNWDGLSNIIIETIFSNNTAGTQADAVIQYNSPVTYQSVLVYAANNQSFGSLSAVTASNINVGLVRPDFKLNGSRLSPLSWAPSAGLSSIGGQTVIASPLVSNIYTITANNGGCVSYATSTLQIVTMPTVSIVSTSTGVCLGNSATLQATGASTFAWDNSATSSSIVITPTIGTVVTVSTQVYPCPVSTTSLLLQVYTLPSVSITASSSTLCTGSTYSFTGTGGATYSWSNGQNFSSINYNITTNTLLTLTGFNSQGCFSTTSYSVIALQVPTIAVSASTLVCFGTPITLTASGAQSYNWNPGSMNGTLVTIMPSSTQVYTVTGMSVQGCYAQAQSTVNVVPNPALVLTPTSPTVCAGDQLVLSVSGAQNYSWNPLSTSGTQVTVTPLSTTAYTVTGTNGQGCLANIQFSVNVLPVPNLTLGPSSTTICLGEEVALQISGANSYTWSEGGFATMLLFTPSINTTVTVYGANITGCRSSVSGLIVVDECVSIGEITNTGSLNVYPNPTYGALYVNGVKEGNILVLYDLTGRELLHLKAQQHMEFINLRAFAKGVYMLTVSSTTGQRNFRLVLE